MMAAKIYVDSWDPAYGTGLDQVESGPTAESSVQLNLDVEVPADSWRPLSPPADTRPPAVILLVDGVRRVDARIWVEQADGALLPGLAASYAAGVVRCDLRAGRAEVAAARIERGLFTPSPHVADLIAANARYMVHRTTATDPAQLTGAVQPQLRELEGRVSRQARELDGTTDDLLVVDGPLHDRTELPRALGYVKTHRIQYLPLQLSALVGGLRPGQRCPIFMLGTVRHRYTWYLKLPGPAGSPWSGVVRVEVAADLPWGEVIRLADQSTVTLPRFASSAYKDSRAPQNLTPIAGLERRLRGMLGDARLLLRSLTSAAAAHNTAARPSAAGQPEAA